MSFNDVYHGKKVLITGHTGFKGSWLTMWLLSLGAKVCGISKASRPPHRYLRWPDWKEKSSTISPMFVTLKRWPVSPTPFGRTLFFIWPLRRS